MNIRVEMQLKNWLQTVEQMRNRIAVMGVLNVTPDSFSDGGNLNSQQSFEFRVKEMIAEGVDVIDIGGESTRPGAEPVGLQQELDRVIPAIECIRQISDIPISIDTYKPEVMVQAVSAGAQMVNDVNALQADGALEAVSKMQVPVCIMHKHGKPKTMQDSVVYKNVSDEVLDFLVERVDACKNAGIKPEQVMIDLGFGFGKYLEHNTDLFHNLEKFKALNLPILVGVSRKRMIGELLDGMISNEPKARLQGSVSAAVVAALKGAKMVRVHDVKQTVEALTVAQALWK